MPLLGVSCYFLFPGMRHSMTAVQDRQYAVEGDAGCLSSNQSGQTEFLVSVISNVQVMAMASHSSNCRIIFVIGQWA
jgi:hypothetical protein